VASFPAPEAREGRTVLAHQGARRRRRASLPAADRPRCKRDFRAASVVRGARPPAYDNRRTSRLAIPRVGLRRRKLRSLRGDRSGTRCDGRCTGRAHKAQALEQPPGRSCKGTTSESITSRKNANALPDFLARKTRRSPPSLRPRPRPAGRPLGFPDCPGLNPISNSTDCRCSCRITTLLSLLRNSGSRRFLRQVGVRGSARRKFERGDSGAI
jgi:hypothetical protein